MKPKNAICLWFNKDALEAARFYAATFPDSKVTAVHKAPADFPSGKEGDVLTVEFTVFGIPCIGLNGGPAFRHSEAFSFQIATEDQEETDRYWMDRANSGSSENPSLAGTDRQAHSSYQGECSVNALPLPANPPHPLQ